MSPSGWLRDNWVALRPDYAFCPGCPVWLRNTNSFCYGCLLVRSMFLSTLALFFLVFFLLLFHSWYLLNRNVRGQCQLQNTMPGVGRDLLTFLWGERFKINLKWLISKNGHHKTEFNQTGSRLHYPSILACQTKKNSHLFIRKKTRIHKRWSSLGPVWPQEMESWNELPQLGPWSAVFPRGKDFPWWSWHRGHQADNNMACKDKYPEIIDPSGTS